MQLLGVSVRFQFRDFVRNDNSPAAAKNLDMTASSLVEEIVHVLEVLEVPTLIGRDCYTPRVLLNGGLDDLQDGPIMTEVDDLGAPCQQQSTHDIDGSVVTIK